VFAAERIDQSAGVGVSDRQASVPPRSNEL